MSKKSNSGSRGSTTLHKRSHIALRRWLSWLMWRYRYLGMFTIIGFLSIALEVAIVLGLASLSGGHSLWGTTGGFVTGMLFAFFANYHLNFRVAARRFWYTLMLFAAISSCSYALNLAAKDYLHWLNWQSYPTARFVTSGCLFAVAYALHRRFTFRHAAKDLGLAVYAAQGTDPRAMFARVGEHCDHVHIDLVDDTIREDAAPVDLEVIRQARELWTYQPFMLHIMSRTPRRWVDACLGEVDVVLVHIDGEDDVMAILAECRLHQRSVGVVAHHSVTMAQLLPYLPHCDYVLVLGIEIPGCSGQPLMPSAIDLAHVMAGLADRYGYRLIFDGGVTVENVNQIPAELIISSSTVLRSEDPIAAAFALMSGVNHAKP